jgi:hypothetical protein
MPCLSDSVSFTVVIMSLVLVLTCREPAALFYLLRSFLNYTVKV